MANLILHQLKYDELGCFYINFYQHNSLYNSLGQFNQSSFFSLSIFHIKEKFNIFQAVFLALTPILAILNKYLLADNFLDICENIMSL